MAKASKTADLRAKSASELQDLLKSANGNLFKAKFENYTNRLNSTATIRLLRREIARLQTVLNEKRRAPATAAKAEG